MKTTLLLCAIIAMLALPALAQPTFYGGFAEPPNAELDKFPIKSGVLSASEEASLGLTAKKLETPVTVFNYFAKLRSEKDKDGRFVFETLPIGTIVLVDKEGKLRYKADCGNRITELPKCPDCATLLANSKGGERLPVTLSAPYKNPWQRLTESMKSGALGLWNFIGNMLAPLWWALLLIFGLILLALIAYGLYRLARMFFQEKKATAQQAGNPNWPPPGQQGNLRGNPPPIVPGAPGVQPHNNAPPVPNPAPDGSRYMRFDDQDERGGSARIRFAGINLQEVRTDANGETTIRYRH